MNGNDYLFNSLAAFFECGMWRGCSASQNPPKLRNWFGWIYVAAFNGKSSGQNQIEDHCQDLRFKIGYTYDLNQRGKALKRESVGENKEENEQTVSDDEEDEKTKTIKWSKKIVYVFSVPRPYMYETRMKQFLYNFINKDLMKGVEGASEIVLGLAFEPLVHILQLCILESTLFQGYIQPQNDTKGNTMKKYMDVIMKIPPDTVKWDKHTYYGRKYGYAQQTTLHIEKGVLETMKKTIDSVTANNNMIALDTHNFDLLKDVASLQQSDRPKFVQYVFNTDGNDGRLNHVNNPSDISDMTYSLYEGAPDNAFSVGDLAFVYYKRETPVVNTTENGAFFPCEIIGYLNGQYAVRWIDSRRQVKQSGKWIVFDKESYKKYGEETLGDFLKEKLVDQNSRLVNEESIDQKEPNEEKQKRIQSRNQRIKEVDESVLLYPLMDQLKKTRYISQNKYRDYIQQFNGDAMNRNLQPTTDLVPDEYRTVGHEYKDKSQLKSWGAMYPRRAAPSERWKTSHLYSVNEPINASFNVQDSDSDSGSNDDESGSPDDVYTPGKWVEEEKEKVNANNRSRRATVPRDNLDRFVSFYDQHNERWIGKITDVNNSSNSYVVDYYDRFHNKTNKIKKTTVGFRKFDSSHDFSAKFIKKVSDFDSEQQGDSDSDPDEGIEQQSGEFSIGDKVVITRNGKYKGSKGELVSRTSTGFQVDIGALKTIPVAIIDLKKSSPIEK